MEKRPVTFDSLLTACQDQHRRIVLAVLTEKEGRTLTLDDLTEVILEYDDHTALGDASEGALTEIRRPLYHTHLPKLASVGLVTYDADQRVVGPTEKFEQVQPTLSTILAEDPALEHRQRCSGD